MMMRFKVRGGKHFDGYNDRLFKTKVPPLLVAKGIQINFSVYVIECKSFPNAMREYADGIKYANMMMKNDFMLIYLEQSRKLWI